MVLYRPLITLAALAVPMRLDIRRALHLRQRCLGRPKHRCGRQHYHSTSYTKHTQIKVKEHAPAAKLSLSLTKGVVARRPRALGGCGLQPSPAARFFFVKKMDLTWWHLYAADRQVVARA
jgi:hypothetical protein